MFICCATSHVTHVICQYVYRWGRRISFLLMIYMAVALSIGTAFSPNYNVYMAFRTINGLTFPALFQIPYILG